MYKVCVKVFWINAAEEKLRCSNALYLYRIIGHADMLLARGKTTYSYFPYNDFPVIAKEIVIPTLKSTEETDSNRCFTSIYRQTHVNFGLHL